MILGRKRKVRDYINIHDSLTIMREHGLVRIIVTYKSREAKGVISFDKNGFTHLLISKNNPGKAIVNEINFNQGLVLLSKIYFGINSLQSFFLVSERKNEESTSLINATLPVPAVRKELVLQ